jgi:preprotein translocase subunit SecG
MTALLIALSFVGVLKSIMFVGFILCALLLILVVLLQEPKGGGLSGAFGGAGAETFGVQTGSVNRFTSWLATVFIVLAIGYAAIREEAPLSASERVGDGEPTIGAPANGGASEDGNAPAGDSGDSSGGSSDSSGDGSDADSSKSDTGSSDDSSKSDDTSDG